MNTQEEQIEVLKKYNLFIRILLVSTVLLSFGCHDPKNGEQHIIMGYYDNKSIISELASMLMVDNKLGRIDSIHTVPDNLIDAGITSTRLLKYRELMSSANISVIMHIGGEVRFYTSLHSSKYHEVGYSLLDNKPSNLIQSLDAYNCDDSLQIVYKLIEAKWYAFAICVPGK